MKLGELESYVWACTHTGRRRLVGWGVNSKQKYQFSEINDRLYLNRRFGQGIEIGMVKIVFLMHASQRQNFTIYHNKSLMLIFPYIFQLQFQLNFDI